MLMRRKAEADAILLPGGGTGIDAVARSADPRHAFLRSTWFAAAAPAGFSTLLAHRADGSPLAALPLVSRRMGPVRVREVPGSYWPFRTFPIAADAADEELSDLLRSRAARAALGRVWRVGPVFDDDPTARMLARAAPRAGWTVIPRTIGHCFEIDVEALTADAPWPRGSTLKKNRWREKKLAEQGPLSFRSFTGTDWTPTDRDAIARVEAGSWVGKLATGGATQFHCPRQRRLWEQVAADPVLAPMLFGSLLEVGGVPAAFTFGLEVGPVRYQIANNYAEEFAAHSPGKILLYRDFESAAARGVERISWGSGDAGYKTDMGAQPGPQIIDLLFVRPRLLGWPLKRYWARGSDG